MSFKSTKKQCCPKEVHIEDIHLGYSFMEDMGRRCMSEVFADVWFSVEGQRLPAHCVILVARSGFFRDLLYGSMPQDRQIPMEVALAPFKVILAFIYTGTLSIFTLPLAAIVDVLGVARLCGLVELEMVLNTRIGQSLHLNNVFMVLDAARLNNLEYLAEECFQFMDRMASELLKEDSFQMVSKTTLAEVLNRNTFVVRDDEIFRFVCEWIRHHPQENIHSLFSLVGRPLTSEEDFVVHTADYVEPENIPKFVSPWPEKDVAFDKYFLRRISGVRKDPLIDLGQCYKINFISIIERLKSAEICYDVEVSCDQIRWDRVGRMVPDGGLLPDAWMNIYFMLRPVRYIRIVNPENGRKDLLNYFELKAKLTRKIL